MLQRMYHPQATWPLGTSTPEEGNRLQPLHRARPGLHKVQEPPRSLVRTTVLPRTVPPMVPTRTIRLGPRPRMEPLIRRVVIPVNHPKLQVGSTSLILKSGQRHDNLLMVKVLLRRPYLVRDWPFGQSPLLSSSCLTDHKSGN